MNRSQRALRSTAVVAGLGYAAQALSLVAIPLFLKAVGAEGYGLMVTVMAFMGYLTFADAGLSWGAMILVAQAEGRGDRAGIAHIVRHGAVLALGSGVVALVALAVVLAAAAAGWRLPMFAAHPEADRLLLIAGAGLVVNLQFGIVYNLFQGLQEAYWAGVYQGGGRLAGLLGAMLAAWTTGDVALMLLAQVLANLVAGLAALAHARARHPWAFCRGPWRDRAQIRAQLGFGAKNFLLQIGRTLGGTAPTLAISSVLGAAAVPFYTVPTTLLALAFTPINSWNSNLQSAYGEAWTAGDRDWVRGAFRLSLERTLLFGGLGIALFLALGDRFVRLWTHDRLWVEPGTLAAVSVIALTTAVLAAGQFLLTGLNCHRRAALAEIANGGLTLGLVAVGVGRFGVIGAGAGVVLSALATSAWVLRAELRAILGPAVLPAGSFVARVLAAAALCALASAGVGGLLPSAGLAGLVQLGVVVGTGLATFGAAALAFRLFTWDAVRLLGRQLAGKLHLLPS